ncbi:uncharacterized protein LOC123320313 [Coccinella septempunctata]|uniref:uncharacterized protein LOC123320313 n=1 Tax=Coccinella septempunctata TaxID=41139 RepID=UPI001D07FEBB|nr:uncharacterized protein LOC123320313 [Coccinella septempunctata]
MMRVKGEESKYPDSKSTNRIIDEEYKKTMATMMKAQVPRKNHIFRNWPQTHQGLPSSIKTTNIPKTSSNLSTTRKYETNLVKNSPNDLISTGSKMMALFSKMLQDAKKMNERKNMMKKRRIRGLIPDKMR